MKYKLLPLFLLALSTTAFAQAPDLPPNTDRIFLCFQSSSTPPIQGETTDVTGLQNCVEATSVSYGVENVSSIGSASGGAGSGKTKFSNFVFKKLVDRASPALFRAAVLGNNFEQVQVFFVRVDKKKIISESFRLQLKFAVIQKIDSGASTGTPATETITIAYGALGFQIGGTGLCFDTVSNSQAGLCTQ